MAGLDQDLYSLAFVNPFRQILPVWHFAWVNNNSDWKVCSSIKCRWKIPVTWIRPWRNRESLTKESDLTFNVSTSFVILIRCFSHKCIGTVTKKCCSSGQVDIAANSVSILQTWSPRLGNHDVLH
jgi:hypothetical protein